MVKASFLLAALATVFFQTMGCSSASKTAPASEVPVDSEKSITAPSESEIHESYSLAQLESVHNALKTIEQAPGADRSGKVGESVLGCSVSVHQAKEMIKPLKALMDLEFYQETEAYKADPIAYADSRGFETCASSCTCGVLASVLEAVPGSSLKKVPVKIHERYLTKLHAKASRQDRDTNLSCAKRTGWFCKSDLRAYLAKEANVSED